MIRIARREGRSGGERFLVIVAHDHSELFPRIRRQFLDDPRVGVILDRRRGERRRKSRPCSPDRRRADQRRAPDYWEDLRFHPVVLIPTTGQAPMLPGVHSSPASATAGGTMEMIDSAARVKQQVDQLCQWLGAGRELLASVAPLLVEVVENLQQRADTAERKTGELRHQLEERDGKLLRLEAEVERLTLERAAVAEAIAATMRKIEEFTRNRSGLSGRQ